jgi:predicted small lipoprotein YifL
MMLYYKDYTMKRLHIALIALIALTAVLAGCGQKGPLYHPDGTPSASPQNQ